MIKLRTLILTFFFCILCSNLSAFPLIDQKPTQIVVDQNEAPVVYIALDMFKADMELVSGKRNVLSNQISNHSILIGTIGKNKYIDQFIADGKININQIKGQWEAFQIQTITHDGKRLLIVVGSDKRGTAYGILELSRLIGVSPLVYWADCIPEKKTYFELPDNYYNVQKPSVQYRGIFINDEDLAFMPWSTKTIDKATRKGATGPKAYAKVFELMLRVRANILWPAMHGCTVPFYLVEGNKETADKYAIVIGTSHHEPLMRNTEEWNKKFGPFNYQTNKKTIISFWTERLKQVHDSENYYTMGIRGIGDVGMEGASTLDEKTAVMDKVLKEQRELLKKYVSEDVEKLPQTFVPYKEVLPIYENGLEVPDDITLMWCDDNYGYMTRQSTPQEQKRGGGSGVYYHVSYLGRPHQYLWLSSTPPALVYWQMKKSWENGARKIWILNVGDIKPAEYDIEFYMDMAWDINSVREDNIYQKQQEWLKREFGGKFAEQLNHVRNEYYRLANIRRPEFMGWNQQEVPRIRRGITPVVDTEFNPYMFGDEIYQRLKEYKTIATEVSTIAQTIPENKKDAYYQLILYPVHASYEMNKKLLYAQKARLYARYELPVANEYATASNAAFDVLESMTKYYNEEIAEGKWNYMMFRRAWGSPVYERAPLPDSVATKNSRDILIWPENYAEPVREGTIIKLTPFVNPTGKETFISVFTFNGKAPQWEISKKPDWIHINEEILNLSGEKRLVFSIAPDKVKSKVKKSICVLKINGKPFTFQVEAKTIKKNIPIEYNKMLIIDVNKYKKFGESPVMYQGLGYTMKAIELKKGKANAIQYKIHTTSSGCAQIRVGMLPNHPINSQDIRYAISIDNGPEQIVSILSDFKNRDDEWKINVLRNQAVKTTEHTFNKPGMHTITIYALDEGIVLDQMAIDFQQDRKFYALPSKQNK